MIPWLIASFSLGNRSLTKPNATGKTEIPIPCNILENSNIIKLEENGEIIRPRVYIDIRIIMIFFFPYMSDNFPLTGVITAPARRYALNIQDEVLYDRSNSWIKWGSAGRSIVSVYIDMVAIELRIASVFQIEWSSSFLLNKEFPFFSLLGPKDQYNLFCAILFALES